MTASVVLSATTTVSAEPTSGLGAQLRRLVANRWLVAGFAIVALLVLFAVVAPYFTQDPMAFSNHLSQAPSGAHWLGTTTTGQDVLAQLAQGGRGSLEIGVLAGLGATLLSVVIGIGGGYLAGYLDEVLSLVSNVALVIPALPLVIVVASYVNGGGIWPTVLVIAFTSWAASARVLRSQTLSLRNRDYVLAARASGERGWRIVLVEILPNEIAIVLSQFIFAIIFSILTESGLAFLGLNSSGTLTWGTMIFQAQNDEALSSGTWWWFLPPGLCIALIGAGFALINFGLDGILNPRLRTRPRRSRRSRRGAA